MTKIKANISKLEHRGAIHIKVDIPNTLPARNLIKTISGRKFSKTHQCWYIPNTFDALDVLKQKFQVESLQVINTKTENKEEAPSHLNQQSVLAEQMPNRDTNKIFTGNKIIIERKDKWLHILHQIKFKKIAESTQNQIINAIKTTEIYLHLSSDALKKLKSPLDNMDI